jgi:VanZ family protein
MGGDGPRATRTPVGTGPEERPSPALPAARAVSLLAPPLLLMALIWYLSAQSHLATDLGWIDLVLRKGAHMTEYALLTLLWARALRGLGADRGAGHARTGRVWVPAAAIALSWAAIDELHQGQVPGRVGTPRDVAIDAVGIALAAVAWRILRRRTAGAPSRAASR